MFFKHHRISIGLQKVIQFLSDMLYLWLRFNFIIEITLNMLKIGSLNS